MPVTFRQYVGALGILGWCLAGTPVGHAQGSADNRLARVKAVRCTFPVYATGNWVNGESKAELKTATLAVGFDTIDTDDGTARAIGTFGPTHIIAKLSIWSLHFLEMTSEGTLRITTVFDKESRAGKLKAVHTRHEYTDVSLPGFTSRPEQYYGECEVER